MTDGKRGTTTAVQEAGREMATASGSVRSHLRGSSRAPDQSKRRIVLVQPGAEFNGSAVSGHLLAAGFREQGWRVDVVFGSEGPYSAQYVECGCCVHVLKHKNWLRGGGWLRSSRRVAREVRRSGEFVTLYRRLKPDLVYVNSLVSLAGALAARRARIPCIWHLREQFADVGGEMRARVPGGKRVVRWMLGYVPQFRVAISRAVAANVLGSDSAANCVIVPNGVPREFFADVAPVATARESLGLSEEGPVVGVPGTLRPVKGHRFFLQAAAQLARKVPGGRFAITGAGEKGYVRELHELAKSLGLEGRIHFLGTVREMRSFYRACDVVCVPSQAEPFGRTVIEAFACGCPLVATAVGGIREIVDDDRTGLLVDYGDVDGLVRGLRRLLENDSLRDRLVSASRDAARRRYSQELCQQRINQLVLQLSAPSRRSQSVRSELPVRADGD